MKTIKFSIANTFAHGVPFLLILVLCIQINVHAQDSDQSRVTVVFVDKTASVAPNSFIQEKNYSWLRQVVKKNVLNVGDKIVISFIYENTSNSTNKYEFVYMPPKPREGRMSSNEKRIAEIQYKKRLRAYKNNFTEKVLAKAFSFEPSLSGTDVVGSVKLLSDISTYNSKSILKAYYFSDMQNCSTFRYLFCGLSAYEINSIAEAQALAKQDLPRLFKLYQLSNDCLQNYDEITVVFPAVELDTDKALSILPAYWSYLFNQLGTTQVNYH